SAFPRAPVSALVCETCGLTKGTTVGQSAQVRPSDRDENQGSDRGSEPAVGRGQEGFHRTDSQERRGQGPHLCVSPAISNRDGNQFHQRRPDRGYRVKGQAGGGGDHPRTRNGEGYGHAYVS